MLTCNIGQEDFFSSSNILPYLQELWSLGNLHKSLIAFSSFPLKFTFHYNFSSSRKYVVLISSEKLTDLTKQISHGFFSLSYQYNTMMFWVSHKKFLNIILPAY